MERLDVTEIFHGISFPGHLHTQDSLQRALEFQFQETDVLIASYPKSGTTWMQELMTLISNRGNPHLSQTVPNWTRAPWLEQYYSASVLENTSNRLITTHLPVHLLGPAIQGSKAKVIYVSRDPRDVAVSFYHFHKIANFLPNFHSFSDFLNKFLDGTLHFGSWFDHVKGWTNQKLALNLLHVTYEEMSVDLRGTIERMCSFLQRPLLGDELNNCVKHSSFSCMKNNQMINYSLVPHEIMDHSKGSFMRKGQIGDWKNTFTEEQNEHFLHIFSSKMQDLSHQFVFQMEPNEDPHECAEKNNGGK